MRIVSLGRSLKTADGSADEEPAIGRRVRRAAVVKTRVLRGKGSRRPCCRGAGCVNGEGAVAGNAWCSGAVGDIAVGCLLRGGLWGLGQGRDESSYAMQHSRANGDSHCDEIPSTTVGGVWIGVRFQCSAHCHVGRVESLNRPFRSHALLPLEPYTMR